MLVVVRHGQAEGNTAHRFIGWSEVPLDDVGRRQATLVAERLATVGVERIVSSPIRRALDTARPLADMLGLEPVEDPGVKEIGNGDWTGLLPQEIEARWPDIWHRYVTGTDVDRPGGERWADVRSRVRASLEALAADAIPTAVFTHGGPIILAAEWALGLELPGNIFRGPLAAPANTSITTIEGGKLISYADAGHLDSLTRLEIPYRSVP